MDIRCRKLNCRFNKEYTCLAKGIDVKKSCECGKYEFDSDKHVEDKTDKIFSSQPPKYAGQRDRAKLDITCNAHCLFNENGICQANGISLNDIKEKPYCTTFLRE